MQDEVFEEVRTLRAPKDEQKEAKVGDEETDLYGDAHDEEQGRVGVLLLLLCLLQEQVRNDVKEDISALDQKDEADTGEVGTEGSSHGHQV